MSPLLEALAYWSVLVIMLLALMRGPPSGRGR